MKENKGFAICGAILLGVMLLAAAFSLGIYVGRYGLTREGLSYAGPGGGMPGGPMQQPQGGQPLPGQGAPQGRGPQAPQPLPPGLDSPPQLIGRILTISPDGLDLATQDGPRPILLTEDTILEDHEGNELTLADLAREDVVGVFGELSGGGAGRTLTATRIVVLPPRPEP
jgi:hypothetical protein